MAGKDASRKANVTRANLAKDSTHDAAGAAVSRWRFCDTHWHDIESMLHLSLANLDSSKMERGERDRESLAPLAVPLGSLAKNH